MKIQVEIGRPKRARSIAITAAILVGFAVGAYFIFFQAAEKSRNAHVLEGPGGSFTVRYPASWKPLSTTQLERVRGALPALAGLARKDADGKGLLVVRTGAALPTDLTAFAKKLTRRFKQRFADFQKNTSKTVRVSGRQALLYSYVRSRRDGLYTLVLVPAGRRSYTLSGFSRAGDRQITRQLATMIGSFKVKKSS